MFFAKLTRYLRKTSKYAGFPAMAEWPYRLPEDLPPEQVGAIQARADELGAVAQYGWGHTIDFGVFQKQGILGNAYLGIAGLLDQWEWWPRSFDGLSLADVGCFTGGLTLLMAARDPKVIYAIDEIPEHIHQCEFLCEVFKCLNVKTIQASLYNLQEHIEASSLDLVLLSGVLYHLSDMLVGLLIIRNLLKPGGVLLIESNAVDDDKQSYANFGRFYLGMWWQPSALCIQDMCEFTGFERPEIRFYLEDRCLARTVRTKEKIPFKRGMNWKFYSLKDERPRPVDPSVMAPVR
ncbi:MAG: methyltransferase domain-containing protein [Actinomycetota bacterium]|nr:methyltransferase domain-containing protein [Actinomycetota bacterium]